MEGAEISIFGTIWASPSEAGPWPLLCKSALLMLRQSADSGYLRLSYLGRCRSYGTMMGVEPSTTGVAWERFSSLSTGVGLKFLGQGVSLTPLGHVPSLHLSFPTSTIGANTGLSYSAVSL